MDSKIFHEVSRFPRLILFLLLFQAVLLVFILTKTEGFNISILYITIPVTLLIASSFLKLNLTQNYFEYNFFPFTFKTKKITWNEIKQIQIVKTNPLLDFGGWGLRISRKYGVAYITENNEIIFLKLKNGKKRSFSIKNKEKLIHFLNSNNIAYENLIENLAK